MAQRKSGLIVPRVVMLMARSANGQSARHAVMAIVVRRVVRVVNLVGRRVVRLVPKESGRIVRQDVMEMVMARSASGQIVRRVVSLVARRVLAHLVVPIRRNTAACFP